MVPFYQGITSVYSFDCGASLDEVQENFQRYGFLKENVVFLKGWFAQSLPKLPSHCRFSVIRIDAECYQSTMDALIHTYPKLTTGGFVIIDDYKLPGCRKAVDAFRMQERIKNPISSADAKAGVVFWRK